MEHQAPVVSPSWDRGQQARPAQERKQRCRSGHQSGDTTIAGLDWSQTWTGETYPPGQFRSDAGVLDGVQLLGSGSVSDMLWARPALTVLGVDCPPVTRSTAAIVPRAAARLNLRVPPGTDAEEAHSALLEHLRAAAPWGVHVSIETEAIGPPFAAATSGPAFTALQASMLEAFGTPMTTLGQGGSIPLCNVLAETYPEAELAMIGVEEPMSLIHEPNENVDPREIEATAHAIARFVQLYAESRSRSAEDADTS